MSTPRHVLAIDQGTTSTRAIVFDATARALASARRELQQHYPASGWVAHAAEDIWRDVHATDITNASRTLLFNIHAQAWDEELLALIRVPRALLPEVRDSSEVYGATEAALFGRALPVAGIAGDQQAALIGQACFRPGMAKSTYGTGCFLLLNTGEAAVTSGNRMLTTPAYRIGGRITYAMEGSIFVAGAAIKWLRDGLRVIRDTAESAAAAARLPDDHGVYLVPAFVGLGAPHWEPDARGP